MTEGGVKAYWKAAETLGRDVGICTCCGGPCPVRFVGADEASGTSGIIGVVEFCKICDPGKPPKEDE